MKKGKKEKNPAEFWRDYEQQLGEPVLAAVLGRYVRGWDGLEPPLWGLCIVSAGGFRFHHFPHESWLQVIARNTSGAAAPPEFFIDIPKDRILDAELRVEKTWWKRLLAPHPPLLLIRCLTENNTETVFTAETEAKASVLVFFLKKEKTK